MTATCCYAPLGSFGHECGNAAEFVRSRPSLLTRSGWFYATRCRVCAYLPGGENLGTSRPEPIDHDEHRNDWK